MSLDKSALSWFAVVSLVLTDFFLKSVDAVIDYRPIIQDPEVFKNHHFVVFFRAYNNETASVSRTAELVELFATRFETMHIFYEAEEILPAVAMYNKNNSGNLPPIQVYGKCGIYGDIDARIKSLIDLSNNANNMYDGTIQNIILTSVDLSKQGDLDGIKTTANVIGGNGNTYRLGLELSMGTCGSELEKTIIQSNNVSLLVFKIVWEESYSAIGVDESVHQIRNRVKQCKLNLVEIGLSLQVGFQLTWPDTNPLGTMRNTSALTEFWIKLALLGKIENVTILVDQAFDAPQEGRDINVSNGWWTPDLLEKATNPIATEIVSIDDHMETSVCHLESATSLVKYIRHGDPSFEFNRNLMTLYLSPDLHTEFFFEKEFAPITEIISKRFSKILILFDESSLNPREKTTEALTALKAVAHRNKIRQERCPVEYHWMEASVGFFMKMFSFDSSDIIVRKQNITAFANILGEINGISGKTVSRVVLFFDSNNDYSAWIAVNKELRVFKSIFNKRHIEFGVTELATLLNLRNKAYMKNWMRFVLPTVDFFYIWYRICKDAQLKENDFWNNTLQIIFRKTQRLTEIFNGQKPKPKAQPGLFLQVKSEECSGVASNHSTAAEFWIAANKMAEAANLNLQMGPGINKVTKTHFAEWYKFYDNGLEYVLEEYESKRTETTTINENIDGMLWIWVILGFGLSLALFIIGALIYIRRRKNPPGLFQQQAIEFLKGLPVISDSDPDSNFLPEITRMPYKTSFEVGASHFSLDTSRLMGSGAFGSVCLAKLSKDGSNTWAAAKSLHCYETKHSASMRSLLMEIKVLIYLGKHENITQLLGAYTAEISSGKVYAFLELCHLGSLHQYLRQTTFKTTTKPHTESNYLCLPDEIAPPSDTELMQWSIQIASGMEYISSKFIIHADLATRNVLLDEHKTAKICDFGLSRRMENYQNYVKTNNEPLPWRWMAYESLTRMEFSTKSDVWSYGVTLWEIYNEGQIPYQGLTWTHGFADSLDSGTRLPQPKNASISMYSLMKSCWKIQPNLRPDFSEILLALKNDNLEKFVVRNSKDSNQAYEEERNIEGRAHPLDDAKIAKDPRNIAERYTQPPKTT